MATSKRVVLEAMLFRCLLDDVLTIQDAQQIYENFNIVDADRKTIEETHAGEWAGSARGSIYFGVTFDEIDKQMTAAHPGHKYYAEEVGADVQIE
jgi:hypothetical protein